MPLVSALTKSLQVKIVYYGPGLSGKTTNLEKLAVMLDKERVGELMSLDTSGDRTLFFDWMPLDLGKIRGFDVKIQLYTVPGQIRYDRTRQQVLRGVDGIVFIADSQREAVEQNLYSFKNLRDNLALSGRDLEEIPVVIQCNKKDLPNTMSTREMAISLHAEHLPFIEASASTGQGILETLRLITRLTMKHVQAYLDPSTSREQPESSQEALDGDTLLSKMLSSEAILKEHRDAEKGSEPAPVAASSPAAAPGTPSAGTMSSPMRSTEIGGAVPSPDEVDRADSSELTPVVEIIEDHPLARPPAEPDASEDAPAPAPAAPTAEPAAAADPGPEMEIEAETADEPVPPEPTVSGEFESVGDPSPEAEADPPREARPEAPVIAETSAVPASSTPALVERYNSLDLSGPVRHVDLVTDPIDEAAPPTPVPVPVPILTPDQVRLIVNAMPDSNVAIADLHRQLDADEVRIHNLELLVARQTVQLQTLAEQLDTMRKLFAQLGRDLDK